MPMALGVMASACDAPAARVPLLGDTLMPLGGVMLQGSAVLPVFCSRPAAAVLTRPVSSALKVIARMVGLVTTTTCGLPLMMAPAHLSSTLLEPAVVAVTTMFCVAPAAMDGPLFGVKESPATDGIDHGPLAVTLEFTMLAAAGVPTRTASSIANVSSAGGVRLPV